MTEQEPGWEEVWSPCEGDYTERLAVPGGWIYRIYVREIVGPDKHVTLAAVFVPRIGEPIPPGEDFVSRVERAAQLGCMVDDLPP